MVQLVRDSDPLLIIYPARGSAFHKDLSQRMAAACEENSWRTMLRSSAEVQDMDADGLTGTTLLIVNPWECSNFLSDKERFFSRLPTARKRITILAEAIETEWFQRQFQLPMQHDMLIDVGFVSQEDKLGGFNIPYRFLFNGTTGQEEQTIGQTASSDRCIPWALVGHYREVRIRLAAELMERLNPKGFVFLPKGGVVKEGQGTIGPSGLASVLSRTEYYVWNSHHEYSYYESLRCREALLAGAMPCKIDSRTIWNKRGIPGIFPSVEALCASIQDEGFSSLQASAREFYLSRGRLANHLKEVLGDV